MSKYAYTEEDNGRGLCCNFAGPGLDRYGNQARFESTYDADRVISMLEAAYKAGSEARALDIRRAIGVHTHWGEPSKD